MIFFGVCTATCVAKDVHLVDFKEKKQMVKINFNFVFHATFES